MTAIIPAQPGIAEPGLTVPGLTIPAGAPPAFQVARSLPATVTDPRDGTATVS